MATLLCAVGISFLLPVAFGTLLFALFSKRPSLQEGIVIVMGAALLSYIVVFAFLAASFVFDPPSRIDPGDPVHSAVLSLLALPFVFVNSVLHSVVGAALVARWRRRRHANNQPRSQTERAI
jgi:predicted Na+-dependent transporter